MSQVNVSMTTDFISDRSFGEHTLKLTAEAGFTHLHWCQHWSDDFIYTQSEIEYIQQLLSEYKLQVSDTHGSHGVEKCWYSTKEACRLAGVELVKNRIDFTQQLGGDAVIVHGPNTHQPDAGFAANLAALNRSLDELEGYARDRNIKLAIENSNFNYEKLLLPVILGRPAEFLGFCYDCGHHNMKVMGETVEQRQVRDKMRNELAERLTLVHLQDNDGYSDCHWIPFRGEMDWNDVTGFLKLANYKKPLNLEVSYGNMAKLSPMTELEFVQESHAAAVKLTKMLITGN